MPEPVGVLLSEGRRYSDRGQPDLHGLYRTAAAATVGISVEHPIMIQVRVNGKVHECPPETTVADLLNDLQINVRYCAVERNQELLPREEHRTVRLVSGDEIEIVTLVGGG